MGVFSTLCFDRKLCLEFYRDLQYSSDKICLNFTWSSVFQILENTKVKLHFIFAFFVIKLVHWRQTFVAIPLLHRIVLKYFDKDKVWGECFLQNTYWSKLFRPYFLDFTNILNEHDILLLLQSYCVTNSFFGKAHTDSSVFIIIQFGVGRVYNILKLFCSRVTGYLRLTLVFVLGSARREGFNICFFRMFLVLLPKLSFWRGDWALGYHSMGFGHFPDISRFPKILSLQSFSNSWHNSYIPCL